MTKMFKAPEQIAADNVRIAAQKLNGAIIAAARYDIQVSVEVIDASPHDAPSRSMVSVGCKKAI